MNKAHFYRARVPTRSTKPEATHFGRLDREATLECNAAFRVTGTIRNLKTVVKDAVEKKELAPDTYVITVVDPEKNSGPKCTLLWTIDDKGDVHPGFALV